MVTDDRLNEYESVTTLIAKWARTQHDIIGAAVVGSWARGAARMESDIDIVVLTTDKARYLDDDRWVAMALMEPAPIVRTQDWGPLTERRVRLPSGLEVEFGFVTPSWAATDPVDAGTANVVRDGCKPLEDSGAVFERLIAALS